MCPRRDLCILLRTTASRYGVSEMYHVELTFGESTHWIANIRGWDDAGVKEDSKELDDRIKIEEHENFLAT